MSRSDELVAIGQVAALYGHVIDARDWTRLDEVYASDGTYQSARGGEMAGIEAIEHYLSSTEQPVTHMTTNVHVDLSEESDKASGSAAYLVAAADGRLYTSLYADKWIRTSSGWRLWHRRSDVAPIVSS